MIHWGLFFLRPGLAYLTVGALDQAGLFCFDDASWVAIYGTAAALCVSVCDILGDKVRTLGARILFVAWATALGAQTMIGATQIPIIFAAIDSLVMVSFLSLADRTKRLWPDLIAYLYLSMTLLELIMFFVGAFGGAAEIFIIALELGFALSLVIMYYEGSRDALRILYEQLSGRRMSSHDLPGPPASARKR